MGKSLVSIIVPCYNQAQYLSETLQSVLDQTYTNWECILVNDGSPDNTEEIALEWKNKDDRFKYFPKKNGGVSEARNFGIKESKGIYILPLDADDKISKTYIEEAVQILDSNHEINVVYCEAEFFGIQKGKWELPKFSYNELLYQNIVFCSSVFRREDFNKTSGYNINMQLGLEDWDFWLTFMELGASFYKLPKIHFYYRISSNSRNQSIDSIRLKSLYKQIYTNHTNLYVNNFGTPQEAYHKIRDIQNSKDYKIGNFILRPFRYIKSKCQKFR